MTARILWMTVVVLSSATVVAAIIYAYRLPAGQNSLLPLMIAAPAALMARLAWRQVRRAKGM